MLRPAQKATKGAQNSADSYHKNQNYPNYFDLEIKREKNPFLSNNEKQSYEDDTPFQRSFLHCQTSITHKIKIIVSHCLKAGIPLLTSHENPAIVMTCNTHTHMHTYTDMAGERGVSSSPRLK